MAIVVAVNVGGVRTVPHHGRAVTTGIWKEPVRSAMLAEHGVAGDTQADRIAHGGRDKAVYAYAVEDYQWWEADLGRPLAAATFGENITTSGIDLNDSLIGERWHVGNAVVEVTGPRIPCFKLGVRLEDPMFPRAFGRADRPGVYLRVVEAGIVSTDDTIEVRYRPTTSVTVSDVARIYNRDRHEVRRLLVVNRLATGWAEWVDQVVAARRELGLVVD